MSDASRSTPFRSDTLCAHGGDTPEGAHSSPLHLSSAADFSSIEDSFGPMNGDGFIYRRYGVPNGDQLARAVAALEGGQDGFATSSGMGAIASVLFSQLKSGDVLVMQRDCYGGSRSLADTELDRANVTTRFVDPLGSHHGSKNKNQDWQQALAGATVALFESVSNPRLGVVDIEAVVSACKRHQVVCVFDNTFATPLRDRPLEYGADIVIHSATKFLGGHHDLCAGVVVGNSIVVEEAASVAKRLGLTGAPLDCWLATRGLRTLSVRMEKSWATATAIAAFLREHPNIGHVYTADRCALISFELANFAAASALVSSLQLITLTPSLGGFATTISHPATSSHRNLSAKERQAVGISDGLLRLSIGIENPDDVIADLEQALNPKRS